MIYLQIIYRFTDYLQILTAFLSLFCAESGEERTLEFLLEPQHVSKVVGESVLLPCVVTGYPTPSVTWMFKDQLIEDR